MQKFDHFELDPNNNRILACDIESYKVPILCLSLMKQDENRVVVYDNGKPMYVFEASGKDEALQKFEELNVFLNRHFKLSPSCFEP